VCGIAGIVGTEPDTVIEAAVIRRMCQTIIHRGPDDEGIYARGAVGLGMRRLSIIDLTSGHQPIHNEDKTVWIVFNGEIYNYLELRRELEKAGHRFYTNTDTEAIVHLYEEFGADCVKKLRGMFAFALYDERGRKLLLARDRLGKKPLHYAVSKGQLLFGSEIKALLEVAPELKEVDRESLLQYFSFGYIPDPDTAFIRIKKLPPGHLLEFSNGQLQVRQYWDLPAYGTHGPSSEEECLEELEHRLAEAVRIRLISDVPLGALLSGGTDSSIVVALMARASSRPVKTFSIGFRHQDFNEAQYARVVAERYGTEHHELIVEPDIAETLDTLTHQLEEPFGDSSMLPTYFVCCLARQHVTVALSGDGGDELFAGYDRYLINRRHRIFDLIPAWAGRQYRHHIYPQLPHGVRGRKFAYNITLPYRERYLHGLSYFVANGDDRSVFSDEFLAWAREQASPLDSFREYFDHAPASDALSRLLYLDTKTYLAGDILTKVDRMSMATSLEVRAPLLDHIFVEWVTGLPVDWKFRGNQQKYILKKLAERVGVPREILYRRKQGFGLPLLHWMRNELRDELPRLLLEPRTIQRGYFQPQAVRQLLDEHFRGRRDHSAEIWLLLVFELWHRNFLEAPQGHQHVPVPARLTIKPQTSQGTQGASAPAAPNRP
jgi:asparagine synthase (glutamine-hydrolysing)